MNDAIAIKSPAELAVDCKALNDLEKELVNHSPVKCPVKERLTPGLYSREIFMPALKQPMFTVITTQIHKTEHQFIVSKGKLNVWDEQNGWTTIHAPYHGITKPGARRALVILEDTIWTTFHPTDKTDLEEIVESLIEPHSPEQEKLLAQWCKKFKISPMIEGDK